MFVHDTAVEFPVWSMLFECSSPAGKLISPVIEELSKKYPHATIYKVDIDTVCKLHASWCENGTSILKKKFLT